jgi:hypothetical protein
MNTKVKTRDGMDAIIIDMNGPYAKWPIAAWVLSGSGSWSLTQFKPNGRYCIGPKSPRDLMLTAYKYRVEYRSGRSSLWSDTTEYITSGCLISRGTFDMDGNLIDICLLTEAQIAELRVTC